MDTIDRLVRLLDKAEARVVEAEIRAMELARELQARPYAPSPQIDAEELARDLAMVAGRVKIHAIKIHRQFARTGLKEAKDAVERHWPAADPAP